MRLPVFAAIAGTALIALTAPAVARGGGPFTVGGRSFAHLDAALASLNGGDGTIRIAPGRYRDCVVQDSGSVAYVAEQPGKTVFDGAICESKATLVLRGRSARVDGIVFTHMRVPDGNGAGIRIEKGDLSVTNAMFIDAQSGILSADDPSSRITIDHSTFSGLGKDPTGNGAHGIYIGDYGSLTVTNSRFERGTGGHYLKDRAPRIDIRDNSFDDSRGSHTNYMIDLSNGATGTISGNSFVAGPNKDNHSTMITVAPEGAENASQGLVVENNRAWLAPEADWHMAFVGNWSDDSVTIRGNELASGITREASH